MEDYTADSYSKPKKVYETPYEYKERSKFYEGENFEIFYEGYKGATINPSKEKKGVGVGIVFKWGGESPKTTKVKG